MTQQESEEPMSNEQRKCTKLDIYFDDGTHHHAENPTVDTVGAMFYDTMLNLGWQQRTWRTVGPPMKRERGPDEA